MSTHVLILNNGEIPIRCLRFFFFLSDHDVAATVLVSVLCYRHIVLPNSQIAFPIFLPTGEFAYSSTTSTRCMLAGCLFFFATRSTQVFSLSQCHHHSVVVLQAPSQATRSLFPVPLFFVFRPAFPSQSRSVASPSVIMVNVARLTAYYSPKTPMI